VVEPIVPAEHPPDGRHPLLGYGMVWAAAALFALNGTVSKVILDSAGISSLRLSQVRSAGALIGIGAVLLVLARPRLKLRLTEVPFLILFGVAGVGFVQWFYFLAIHRLPIGISLLIQYTAPLLVALWARFALGQEVRRRVWLALVLALMGLVLVTQVWKGGSLDGWGVLASFAAAVTFALYILLAERAVGRRDAISLTAYGFLFASLFWAVVAPWWSFPTAIVDDSVSLLGNLSDVALPVWLLMGWMILLGTIVPFVLVVSALRHIPATRVAIVAMLEPVVATVIAFAWLDETLGAAQLAGGAVVLTGILLAQTAR
jgi:drug/metabolite transporter (DMT)-like permease